MQTILLDFETRSRCALSKAKKSVTSAYKYAQHPSTEVLCAAYSIDGGPWELWHQGDPPPVDEPPRIESFMGEFEWCIWNYVCVPKYDWPELPIENVSCLAARAYYIGLPRQLSQICRAIGLGHKGKDSDGHAAMMELTAPKKAKLVGCEYVGGEFNNDPDLLAQNDDYCQKDIVAEQFVSSLAPPLSPFEQRLWEANQRINLRGVPVDLALAHNANQLVATELARLATCISDMTGGKITAITQLQRIKDWCKELGYPLPNMQEDYLASLPIDEVMLKLRAGEYKWDAKRGDMPGDVAQLLHWRQLSSNTAVKKFAAIATHANADERCQGEHTYYKAGPGRFAGRGVNFLNLTRLVKKEIPGLVELADEISDADEQKLQLIYDRLLASPAGVIPTLAKLPRMGVRAPNGKKLVVRDYSGIEYRMIHWMAGDNAELKRIREFDQGIGVDPYLFAAASIYNVPVSSLTKESPERQVGKVQRLACQYLGGAATFVAFCEIYGIDMPLDKAQEIVQNYRRGCPLVKSFWYAVQKAANKAIQNPGRHYEVGPFEYYMAGCTLNARLPSGRELKYYDADLTDGPFGDEVIAIDQRSGMRRSIGLPTLVENLDQAASRDLLADALIRCDEAGLPVVLHVYDEIVLEVDEDNTTAVDELKAIMCDPPAWAKGLPVNVEGGESRRYTK